MNASQKQSLPYIIALSLLWGLLGVIYYYTPYVIDDEHFRNFLSGYFTNPNFQTFMESWKESFIYRFYFDNGRIFNLIATPIMILPKWLLACALSACSIANIYLVAKISNVWKESFSLFCTIIFLYIFTLPWADHMFTTMFSLNYIAASVPALLILYIFLHNKHIGAIPALALGFLSAWCHEGIAGPLALGMIATMICYKSYRTRTALFILAGMAIGVSYLLFLVPGTRVRTSNATFSFGFFNFYHFIHHALPLFLLFATTLCAFFIKGWRRKIHLHAIPAIYGICIGAVIVWLLWMTGARLTWFLDLTSVLGIAILFRPVAPKIPKAANLTIAIASLTIVTVHLAACIPYARAYMQDYENIRRLYAESTTGEVFYDTLEPWDAPQYLLGKVNYNGLHAWTYSTRRTIPMALSNFRPENAEIGFCNKSKAYIIDGKHVVIEDYPGRTDDVTVDFIVNDKEVSTLGFLTPFTGADGKKYLYCRPGVVSLRKKWENVSGVIITRAD